MMPRSTAFDVAAVSDFAKPLTRLELLTPDGRLQYAFWVASGGVTFTRSNGAIVAQLNFDTIDETDELGVDEQTKFDAAIYGKSGVTYGSLGVYGAYSQTIQTGVLMPYGSEVKVYAGFELDSGPEMVPVGSFQLEDVSYDGKNTLTLTTTDRSLLVRNNAWGLAPYTINQDTNYGAAILDLLKDRLGAFWRTRVGTNFATTSFVTPKLDYGTSPGGDPWSDLCTMARVIQMNLYVDRTGTFQLQPGKNPKVDGYDWVLKDGEDGTLVSVKRSILKSKSYNAVIVRGSGSNSDEDAEGEAADHNPLSPTYIDGPFGYKPLVISTPLVTDSGMAQNLANFLFVELLGMYEQLEVEFLPQYALEITDIVRVQFADLGIDYNYMIDRLSLPFGPDGLMSATLRRRKEDGDF